MQKAEVNHILDIFGNTSDFSNYLTITLAAPVGGFLFVLYISYQDMISVKSKAIMYFISRYDITQSDKKNYIFSNLVLTFIKKRV